MAALTLTFSLNSQRADDVRGEGRTAAGCDPCCRRCRLFALDEANEDRTLAALKAHRQDLFDPTVDKHGGRIFKVMGDGLLVEFSSALSAALCAHQIQQAMALRNAMFPTTSGSSFASASIWRRHRGWHRPSGDGVNVAARLEGLAEPGGICLSSNVHSLVRRRMKAQFDDLGRQEAQEPGRTAARVRVRMQDSAPAVLTLPDKPSDRGPALYQYELGQGVRLFRRRPDRRPDHRHLAQSRPVRHCAKLGLCLQGQGDGRARDRERAWRPLHPGRLGAALGRAGADQPRN